MSGDDRFRTVVEIPDLPPINHRTKIALLGSCFASTIGERLSSYLFPINLNPFGIIYNTGSIAYSLHRLIQGDPFRSDELSQKGDLYFSWRHHGEFSGPDRDNVLESINRRFNESSSFIRSADILILTLGTSRIYRRIDNGEIVANCHKDRADNFKIELLTPARSEELLRGPIEKYLELNRSSNVILTVSPVRHRKDGLVENQLSKSSLIVAARILEKSHPRIYYFPAYEIMMDELRDYRFYESDMLHPDETARDYIWDRFVENSMDKSTISAMNRIKTIQTRLAHRPFHPRSDEYRRFLAQTKDLIDSLSAIPESPNTALLYRTLAELERVAGLS